jgi:hypothetical protein
LSLPTLTFPGHYVAPARRNQMDKLYPIPQSTRHVELGSEQPSIDRQKGDLACTKAYAMRTPTIKVEDQVEGDICARCEKNLKKAGLL